MAKGVSIYIVKFDKINYLKAVRYFGMGNLLTNEQFENSIYKSSATKTRN